ncbi:MAG: leucyl/phenylalanyl-tRNA--protein transferase [Albidovulum sp.]
MLTPERMLDAYRVGVFPMAVASDSPELHWVEPTLRGVFPLDRFHISRSLRKRILAGGYEVVINGDFAGVVGACAARPETWINDDLHVLYQGLHKMGRAHSIEVREGGVLIGGVFGLTIGAAFFGESMFSRKTDGSKIALAYLVGRLREAGFKLFDTQFLTPHLASLGAIEIPRLTYLRQLKVALVHEADFLSPGPPPQPYSLMQCMTQTS